MNILIHKKGQVRLLFDQAKFKSCFFTSIEKNKSNKAAAEAIFAMPNVSANI